MSIIIGLIFNNEAIIASDTLVTNYEKNFTEQKSGFRKILHYALNPENFLIGVGGILTEINQFTEALKNLQIIGDYVSVHDFSLYCHNILKSLSLEHVALIIGGYDSVPRIRLVVSNGIKIQENETGFLFIPPGSCSMEEQNLIHKFFTAEKPLKTREDALNMLRSVIKNISELDQRRSVNEDFHYGYISNTTFFIAKKSDQGFCMQ